MPHLAPFFWIFVSFLFFVFCFVGFATSYQKSKKIIKMTLLK